MTSVTIQLTISQRIAKVDIDEAVLDEFEDSFFDPDAYFMDDSLPEEFGIDVVECVVKLANQEIADGLFCRSISADISLKVDDWNRLQEFLEEDGCLIDDKLDSDAFVRNYIGDWERIHIDESTIDINDYEVSGSINISK